MLLTIPIIPVRLLILATYIAVGIGLLIHPVRVVIQASLGLALFTLFASSPALLNSAIANNPVLYTDMAAVFLTVFAYVAARNAGFEGR